MTRLPQDSPGEAIGRENSEVKNPGGSRTGITDSAGELFQTAALLTGDRNQAVANLETTLAEVNSDPCADPAAFEQQARSRLLDLSLRRMAESDPEAFSPPEVNPGEAEPCVETDELGETGLSRDQLVRLLDAHEIGSGKTREWMERLPAALRVVFVLRAILREDSASIATRLRAAAGPRAAGWSEPAVRFAYRRALCRLASSLAGANSSRAPSF